MRGANKKGPLCLSKKLLVNEEQHNVESRERKGTGKMKWRDSKGPLFVVLEIKKGLTASQFIVEYLDDCRTVCTSVNCFYQKFCHFPSGRETFYFPSKFPRDFF